jgi:hypothetical protein
MKQWLLNAACFGQHLIMKLNKETVKCYAAGADLIYPPFVEHPFLVVLLKMLQKYLPNA